MQQISLVVAMNYQRVIGSHNQLPWHIPEDLAHFKQVTMAKPIIMGRKTFESIGRVLPGRPNLVVSRNNYSYPGLEVYASLDAAFAAYPNASELCVIGGGEIFQQALPLATILHLTWVDYPVAEPGAWFPEVNLADWQLIKERKQVSSSGISCNFCEYHRKSSL